MAICFSPSDFARISFHFEVLKALRTTKLKDLAVVTGKHHTVARVNIAGTEVALLNPHI
jgi:hypothetical protein